MKRFFQGCGTGKFEEDSVLTFFLIRVPVPAPVTVLVQINLKGLSHEIFEPVFLGCIDVSRPECEPLVVFKF